MALDQYEVFSGRSRSLTVVILVWRVPAARSASVPWYAPAACQCSPPCLWPELSSSSVRPHVSPITPPAPQFQPAASWCPFPAEAAGLSAPCLSCSGTEPEPQSEPAAQETSSHEKNSNEVLCHVENDKPKLLHYTLQLIFDHLCVLSIFLLVQSAQVHFHFNETLNNLSDQYAFFSVCL